MAITQINQLLRSVATPVASGYRGPFAVVPDSTSNTWVEILGNNSAEGRYFQNYIILGLSRTFIPEQSMSVASPSEGYIYIDITYSGTYNATYAYGAILPAQSATHIYHPIAYVKCVTGNPPYITQLQYGIIHFPARVL